MKKMIILFSLLIIKTSYSQVDLINATSIYDFIYEYKNVYDTSILNDEGGIGQQIRNLEMIWSPRLYPEGDCQDAANAIYNYVTNYSMAITNYNPNWSCLGPTGLPDGDIGNKGNGQMGRLCFAPNYNNTTSKTIYACSSFGGLWRTVNNGGYWKNVNTDLLPFAGVADVCINPSDTNQLFICTGYSDGRTAIHFCPNWNHINPLFTHGLFRSNDYGVTWENINTGFFNGFENGGTCRRMIINPSNPDIIFLATTLGVYRTDNATAIDPNDVLWENVFSGISGNPDLEFRGLEFHPINPNIVYASGIDIYRSNDGGDNWNSMTGTSTGLDLENLPNDFIVKRINITVTPASEATNYLYAYIEGAEYVFLNNVWKWRDCMYLFVFDGNNWVQIEYRYYTSDSANVSDSWIAIAVSPVNFKEVYYGTTTVWGTEDYTQLSGNYPRFESRSSYSGTGFHADVHDLKFQPFVSTPDLYAATDGGINVKDLPNTNNGNWSCKYDGLQVTTIWAFDDTEWDRDQLIIGNQDCGTNAIGNGLTNWKHIQGGDGYGGRIHDGNHAIAFVTPGFSNYFFGDNSTTSEYSLRPIDPWPWPSGGETVIPKTFPLYNNPLTNTMYFGLTEVYKRKKELPQQGDIWSDIWEIDSDLGKDLLMHERQIIEFVICESDTNTAYAITAGDPPIVGSHLFKTTIGGSNGVFDPNSIFYEQLEFPGNGTIGEQYPILTGITVDPMNKDRIWISYTGYIAEYKVWYSDDGGISWVNSDPNGSLNNLPVNAIAYQYGTPDRIYIGTDAGVYTRDSLSTDWEKYGDFPNVRVTELKINYCANKIRVATFGRGVWEGDLVEYQGNYVKEIDDDIILNTNLALKGSLKINDGATLTLKKQINIPANHKIIIQPGGKLILDGGTLTNGCGDIWQGIEVWGNPNATQIPANQGILQVINGGTIENAEVAVRVGSEDYTGKGGGIVYATDANFKNNDIGVWFDPYSYSPSNASYFRYCAFDYDRTITGEANFTFAKLNSVDYVNFEDCDFTNNSSQNHVGIGIESVNSTPVVEGKCTTYQGNDCTAWEYGLFSNLYYAIYATAANATDFADVRHTTFTNNFRSIYLSGMTLPRVTSNWFYLNEMAAEESYGLYLDGSTQYWVEDNTFRKCDECERETGIGIYVNASGAQPNEIYLNAFDGVEYAVITLGVNRTSNKSGVGLVIRCNDYNNTLFDETIIYDGLNDPPPTNEGISKYQGNSTPIPLPTDMAGNLFYYNTTVSGDFDDLNNESNYFYYYYSDNAGANDVEPLDYTSSTVQKIPKTTTQWTYENGCPSNLTTGGGGGTEESRAAMNEALSDIESTETVLLALVDGGDTESLKTEVETSTPPETSEIYTELMSESPNLSETVVETSIEKEEVLPNAMIRDIMVSNPHTSTSLQLLAKLDDRTNPMPAWMKAQILAGRSIQSLKTELEGQLANHEIAKYRAMNRLARYFGQQPEYPAITDSLIALYQSDNTVSSRYMQAWLYLYSSQYQQGQNIMTTIPSNFTLTEDELAEYQNMQWLYTSLKGLFESGNSLNELSESQIVQLNEIVAGETGVASVYARNILLAIDESEYREPVILPNSMKSAEAEGIYNETLKTKAPSMLEVYPNPSKDFVIIGYQFDTETEGMIEVRDVSGRLMKSIPVKGMNDQLTVTTRTWKAGVYMLSLVVNGKVILSAKFTLIK